MAVGEVFKKRFPKGNLFFIEAGLKQSGTNVNHLGQEYLLPKAFLNRHHFREHVQTADINVSGRSKVCKDVFNWEKPDLFITEFFPLGWEACRYELIPSLIDAFKKGTALWAVAGYPVLTEDNSRWREKILRIYNRIIIFSPPEEKDFIADSFNRKEDKKKYLDFFDRNAQKITFAGYLLPQKSVMRDDANEKIILRTAAPKHVRRVTVVRGGGAYYPKIIAAAIVASDLLGKKYCLTVVAGPSTTTQEWSFFSTLVHKKKIKNLVLLRSVGNYEQLIKESDVCVSVASYHSAVMLLKHRKKAVLIPFAGYGNMFFSEQPARAEMLKEMIGARILSFQNLSAKTLTDMIKDAADSQTVNSKILQKWFVGGDVLDEALINFFKIRTN